MYIFETGPWNFEIFYLPLYSAIINTSN